jgi:hemin uptake protein HemP
VEKESDPARRPPARRPAPAQGPAAPFPRRIPSGDLLGGRAEVEILHGEEVYRLRLTRGGKLILTK